MAPPWTLPEKLAISGDISTVMDSWWVFSSVDMRRLYRQPGSAGRWPAITRLFPEGHEKAGQRPALPESRRAA